MMAFLIILYYFQSLSFSSSKICPFPLLFLRGEGGPQRPGWAWTWLCAHLRQGPQAQAGLSAPPHLVPPSSRPQLPTARMIAFAMALMGCVLIMYKAIWYDQFTCPDGFLLRVRP